VTGPAQPGDTFSQDETVSGIVPGSGPVAITAEVRGANPGTWTVTARPVARASAGQAQPDPRDEAVAAGRVPWPRRVRIPAPTPALLIGMGIGRHGCFWAGCCTGRPTASRWGIWSSDRRLGCRRMPVQLLEAWTALAVGAGSLIAVLLAGLPRSGPVAVAGLAAYTLIRQLILGLRDEPRQWRYGRPVTAAVAAIALIAGAFLFAVA
jgi:Prolipoprotein diacylglyceryl transferase